MVFIVVIVHVACTAAVYKIKLKCGYNNEAYNAVHEI